MLSDGRGGNRLSPAYDLLNVAIANPKDTEELALTLNGKKSRLRLSDFKQSAATVGISGKVVDGMVAHFRKCLPAWESMIDSSFLSEELRQEYRTLLLERLERLKL